MSQRALALARAWVGGCHGLGWSGRGGVGVPAAWMVARTRTRSGSTAAPLAPPRSTRSTGLCAFVAAVTASARRPSSAARRGTHTSARAADSLGERYSAVKAGRIFKAVESGRGISPQVKVAELRVSACAASPSCRAHTLRLACCGFAGRFSVWCGWLWP